MPRVAAVDCGTNSIRLLVTDLRRDPDCGLVQLDVTRRMQVVRLGAGVDATGRLDPAALQRTFVAVEEYAEVIAEAGVEQTRFVATSATRDAANAADFLDGVQARLGVKPEVISGAEEAALSFGGATGALVGAHAAPFGVVDIGGGSTEMVVGLPAGAAGVVIEGSLSVDVGCVRLTERHLHDDPPSPAQVAAAQADVEAALDRVEAVVPLARIATLVGVAGTVTTLAAATLDLDTYDPEAIHGSSHTVADVLAVCERVVRADRATRASWPYMHPGRVDVIGAGAVVWAAVVERVADRAGITHVTVSERDILDGIAASLLTR